MESISRATCSLGLIVYSFGWNWSFIDEHGRRDNAYRNNKFLRNFASATEDLLEILESLNSSSHNPMGDLPPKFECTAEACATDIENIRRDMGKGVIVDSFFPSYTRKSPESREWTFYLYLNLPKVKTWTSTLQSYDNLLRPHVKPLAGNAAVLKRLQNTQPTVVNAISGVDANDGINLKAGIPRHLDILAEDLLLGRMDFSGPQLYRIWRTLDEICDEEFPNEQVEAASEAGSMDESDTEFWFCEQWESFSEKLWGCKEKLGLVSLLNHPEDPTPEARSAIIVLQKLTLALKSASQQKPSGRAGVKRKVKDSDDELEYGRKKPVRAYLPMPCKFTPHFHRNGALEGYKHKVYSQGRLDNRPSN